MPFSPYQKTVTNNDVTVANIHKQNNVLQCTYVCYVHMCVCVCIHTHTHTYIYTHTHTHIYIYIYIYIYICTYVCMYACMGITQG